MTVTIRPDGIKEVIPPLSDADWDEAFAKYRQTPEFREVNHAMGLAEFKGIFWWEYFHRLLGRVIGMAFLLPYLGFLACGRIPRSLRWPLAGIFALGALQGALGWFMVQSGLVDDPRVSQFRLTAHLGLAFAPLRYTKSHRAAPITANTEPLAIVGSQPARSIMRPMSGASRLGRLPPRLSTPDALMVFSPVE